MKGNLHFPTKFWMSESKVTDQKKRDLREKFLFSQLHVAVTGRAPNFKTIHVNEVTGRRQLCCRTDNIGSFYILIQIYKLVLIERK